MPEPDDLGELFVAFRTHSLAATVPPGVDRIRRSLRRRRSVRISVAGIVALVVLAATWLPAWRETGYPVEVGTSHTPSPSAVPSPTPPPSGTVEPGGPGGPGASTSARPTQCQISAEWDVNYTYLFIPPEVRRACPSGSLRYYATMYHWSRQAQRIVLYSSYSYTLDAAHAKLRLPSLPLPPDADACGHLAFFFTDARFIPDTMPNYIGSDGTYNGPEWQDYFQAHGAKVLWQDIHMYPDAALRAGSCGRPPPTPTPTTTPTTSPS